MEGSGEGRGGRREEENESNGLGINQTPPTRRISLLSLLSSLISLNAPPSTMLCSPLFTTPPTFDSSLTTGSTSAPILQSPSSSEPIASPLLPH